MRARTLEVFDPKEAASVAQVFPRILKPAVPGGNAGSPLWIDLACENDDADFHAARVDLLRALIVERERLSRDLARPMLVVLPAQSRGMLAEMIPLNLDYLVLRIDGERVVESAEKQGDAVPEPEDRALVQPEIGPSRDPAMPSVSRWKERRGSRSDDELSISDGFAAIDAAITQGYFELARSVADQVLMVAKSRQPDTERGGANSPAPTIVSVTSPCISGIRRMQEKPIARPCV